MTPSDQHGTLRRESAVADRAPQARRRRNPRAGGRPKIDWGRAFDLFARDVTISYGDVARTFGVSETAVRNHARRGGDFPEGWQGRRADLIAKATARNEERIVRDHAHRRDDNIRVAELLRKRILQLDADDETAISQLDLELAVRTLPQYAKLEELYAGEATDRVAIAEVQDWLVRSSTVPEETLDEVFAILGTRVPSDLVELIVETFGTIYVRRLRDAAAGLPLGDADAGDQA